MGQAQGLIADILATVENCELCGTPAAGGKPFEIYTIEALNPSDFSGLTDNIVVLCPGCKARFDDGTISRRHLKACVRLREPGLTKSLKDVLGQYELPGAKTGDKTGAMGGILGRLISDQKYFERLVFVACIAIIALGIFLFAIGYQNAGLYDPGAARAAEGSGLPLDGLVYPVLELAGVALVLLGAFFQLGLARKPAA